MDNGIDLGIAQLTDAEVIGQGGFSTVYAATDTQFDRRVAVKVLRKLTKDSDRVRFERECKVMGRLSSHPNVVTVYHAGYTDDDEPYLIMELNQDGSLADLMKAQGQLPWEKAAGYMVAIARALHHAHAAQILHRDIKPENILVAADVPQLTDFGIAYLRDSTGNTSTNITASWLHTAPETFDNKRDERSDIYSAASTLYNLIAGQAPLENSDDESLNPLMRRLLNEVPPPLPSGLAPAALNMFISRALAKDPNERPQTAQGFADGLQVILDSGGVKLPTDNTSTPATGSPGSDDDLPPPTVSTDTASVPGPADPPRTSSYQTPLQQTPADQTPADQTPADQTPSQQTPSPANPQQSTPAPVEPVASLRPDPTPGRPQPPAGAPSYLSGPGPVGQQPPAAFAGQAAPRFDQAPQHLPVQQPASASPGRSLLRVFLVLIGLGVVLMVGFIVLGTALFISGTGEITVEDASVSEPESGSGSGNPPGASADDAAEEPVAEPEIVPPSVIPPTFSGPAQSIDELEQRWAESRAAVVTALSSDAYGVGDDNVLRGPGGFEVDLDSCPGDWSDTAPLDRGSILIGHTATINGPIVYGDLGQGLEGYFDYVNANGGVAGLDIELAIRDDENDLGTAVQAVDELITNENVFALTTLGTQNSLGTYSALNADCIPHPFVVSAHPGFGDPVEHPFTSGLQMSWSTEAILWGSWIEENLTDQLPVRVGALVMDNDFGLAYESPFQAWADAHPEVISEFVPVSHDPVATDLVDRMSIVAASDPDVFISMTAGSACPLVIQAAGDVDLAASVPVFFQPSVCRDPATHVTPGGAAADGILVVSGGQKSVAGSSFADDVYVSFVNEQMTAAGLDPNNALHANGYAFLGWSYVEALRIAAELPGGLSRTNFLLATRSMDLIHPLLLDGVSFRVEGTEDAFFLEGSDIASFDAASGTWVSGVVIDRDGETPSCPWTRNGCS